MTYKTFKKLSQEAYNSQKIRPTSKSRKNKVNFLQLIKSSSMELNKGSMLGTRLGKRKLITSRPEF